MLYFFVHCVYIWNTISIFNHICIHLQNFIWTRGWVESSWDKNYRVNLSINYIQEQLLLKLNTLWSVWPLSGGTNSKERNKEIYKEIYNCIFPMLCFVTQSGSTLHDPIDCSPLGSSVHGILQARILEWVAMLSFRESSQSRNWTQVSRIAGRFFTIWAKNMGVGSLSFLQGVIPTQKLIRGLLHCMQILYQMSYQGSPYSFNIYLQF